MTRLLALCAVAVLAWTARAESCVQVEGDRILASDLARAVPLFGQLDPGLPLLPSPSPGLRRVLSSPELRQLARRNQLPEVSLDPVCFEQVVERLTGERVLEALRKSLDDLEAKIEIVDFPRFAVPRGELDFPRAGLAAPSLVQPDAPVLWRGVLRYGQRRSLPVWARVRIRVSRRQVVAARELPAGKPIALEDLVERNVEGPPAAEAHLQSMQDAVAAVPRRRIPSGQPLLPSMLRTPNDVQRGDLVSVEVRSGAAQLRFEGRAETGGPLGAPVYVKNPVTGRRFTATVEGKGKVAIRLSPEESNEGKQ